MKEGAELVQWAELGAVAGDGARMGVEDLREVGVGGAEDLGVGHGRLLGELEHEGTGLGR